jgi:FkbH-like protein
MVFIDDSSVECDRMRQALPEVLTVQLSGEPCGHASVLRQLSVFDSLRYGPEDRGRGEAYRVEADRRKLKRELPSLEEFYASLDLRLTIERVADDTVGRAADLTQRTNQFNLNPRRYTPAELQALLAAADTEGYLFRVSDRFGDSGIIGFAVLETGGAEPVISQFLMSCRVLKRTIEDTVLAFLVDRARRAGRRDVTALAMETRRNEPAREFVEARGFVRSASPANGPAVYRLPAEKSVSFSKWVTLVTGETLMPGLAR